jgi:alginate O-acetyltransferase complex protein AlgJ
MKRIINCFAVLALFVAAAVLAATPGLRETSRDLAEKSGAGGVVTGVDGWLFLTEELQHLAAGKFWGESAATASRTRDRNNADPLPAIEEYNTLLADRGITLYLMPVPPKALIYPDKLASNLDTSAAAEDLALYREFYEKVAASGVRVIDLLPALLENRDKAALYCRTDTHYSGEGLALFATAAAEQLKKEAWYADMAKKQYALSKRKVTIRGDLTQMAGITGSEEELELVLVSGKDDGRQVESDAKSPVILLGDSHTLVFQAGGDLHAKGAGLFDRLSAELGFPVDLLGVRGSGVTPARIKLFQRAKQDGSYLNGKKALIWCFAAREFTGSGGWKTIPVAP